MNSTETGGSQRDQRREFFARPLFRSAAFITLAGFSLAFVVADGVVLVRYWTLLRPGEVMWLLILAISGAAGGVLRILRAHAQIHELYDVGMVGLNDDRPLKVVLGVAERSLEYSLALNLILSIPYLWLFANLAAKR